MGSIRVYNSVVSNRVSAMWTVADTRMVLEIFEHGGVFSHFHSDAAPEHLAWESTPVLMTSYVATTVAQPTQFLLLFYFSPCWVNDNWELDDASSIQLQQDDLSHTHI